MTIYYSDKQSTQEIKKFLSDNTRGKIMDKDAAKATKSDGKFLSIRGETTSQKTKKK
jgi:hypothetical protein